MDMQMEYVVSYTHFGGLKLVNHNQLAYAMVHSQTTTHLTI